MEPYRTSISFGNDANLFRTSQLFVPRHALDRIAERSGIESCNCHRTIALKSLFASEFQPDRGVTTHFGNPAIKSEQFLGRYQDFLLTKQPYRQVRLP